MRSVDDLTAIPAIITAGDSYGIVLSYSDYPATSGWALSFAIAGASVKSWTSSAENDSHRLTLSTSDTSALTAGTYGWRVRASDGTDARVVESGTLVVEADLGELAPNAALSWEEVTLPIVEAALSGTLEGEMQMYMIGGRQVMTFKPSELMEIRAKCKAAIARQRNGGVLPPVVIGSFKTYDRAGWE